MFFRWCLRTGIIDIDTAACLRDHDSPLRVLHFGFAYHMDFRTEPRCSVRPNDCIFDPVDLVRDEIEDVLH